MASQRMPNARPGQAVSSPQTSPSSQQPPGTLVGHGVLRGHVVVAVGVLRNRLAEPWTLSSTTVRSGP